MRLVTYDAGSGPQIGAIKDGAIVELTAKTPHRSLRALIAANAIASLTPIVASATPTLSLDKVRLLPPIPDPGKIICVGLNYHDHVAETGRKLTAQPTLFNRYPESQMGHLADMIKPIESDKLDYEGELAIVISKGGRRIKAADAMSHIAGYSCYNDGSVRDWQSHTIQFMPGKNFVGTGGFGPWLVTADEIADPTKLKVVTRLNGQVMQSATVDMMITPIPEQIAYISTFIPLEAGDVIVTGTPGGVGSRREPPLFMKDGDVVEIEIDEVGTLRNTVVAETR